MSSPFGKATILRGATLLFFLILTACSGSRYSKATCPGNVFPESSLLLKLAPFRQLAFFKGNSNDRSPIDFEVWADRKFEFDASLQYHYDKRRPESQNCPCAVSLLVRHPLSKQRKELGRSFILFLAASLSSDPAALEAVFSEFEENSGAGRKSVIISRDIIGEIFLLRHVTRGNFLQIGYYNRDYYELYLQAQP